MSDSARSSKQERLKDVDPPAKEQGAPLGDVEAGRLKAILDAGSSAHSVHAGATLTRMFKLAKAGELEEMSRSLLAHVALFPADRHRLTRSVPAKVLNGYIYICRERSVPAVERWRAANPDWADVLEEAVLDPARFVMIARGMAAAVGRLEG